MSVNNNQFTLKLIENKVEYLALNIAESWYQEDIDLLAEKIFALIEEVKVQDKDVGADREDIRFTWQKNFYILHFDCYSQSCWVEGQDSVSTAGLLTMFNKLKS